ncbi:gamma carbonic anhydrase family protein [Amphibiibacter pelophylacis]|uniref:Gamma carbonic anhydrase family protein n=1 Tax=Amphibiibacter pelophylacis TaxID=1799477 RepID=A0ACC6P201_9BURK
MAIHQLGDDTPRLASSAWVADSADVVGRVELGEHSSVWYGAVLRGDNEWIRIGARSNIQDNSTIHSDLGVPMVIGENVTVGHGVILHSCTIGDNALIGMGATVLNGARIGANCLVGANALVTENKSFPDGSLIVGSPARVLRALTEQEIAGLRRSADHYVETAQRHRDTARRLP